MPYTSHESTVDEDGTKYNSEIKSSTMDSYPYYRFLQNTGKVSSGRSTQFYEYGFYSGGVVLFPIDLSPDLCNGRHIHSEKKGDLKIELSYHKETTYGITMFVLLIYDQIVYINRQDRSVRTKYF